MSWKAQVIADNSGRWAGNDLRFATKQEAGDYVDNLASRWTSVRQTRTVETEEPVNAEWRGRLVNLSFVDAEQKEAPKT